MNFDELIALLNERSWPTFPSGDGQVRTFCPVCEGLNSNSPSLSIKRVEDGDAVMYCFSGRGACGLDAPSGQRDAGRVMHAFEAFKNAQPPRDAGSRWRARGAGVGNPEDFGARVVAEYDYGRAKKVRYEWPDVDGSGTWRKDFRWRPRKPGPCLYRPPEGEDRRRAVFLVEGEKDVDRLREHGIIATSPSEGHISHRLTESLSESPMVFLMRDYDLHGARMREFSKSILFEMAIPFTLLDLPGAVETDSGGYDVSDWLDEGHTTEELKLLAVAATQPQPEVENLIAMPMGWRFEDGWMQRQRGTRWEKACPFNVVPHEMLVDEDGIVRAYDVTFSGAGPRDARVLVFESFLGAQSRTSALLNMGGPGLTSAEASAVADFLAAVRSSATRARNVITRAEWVGEDMKVPGAVEVAPQRNELSAYGHRADIDEEEARRAWGEVVALAVGKPKLMAALGMPLGSLYVTQLDDPQLFTLHLTGESHSGKSESAEMAMSTVGEARRGTGRVYRSWNMSAKAPQNVLRECGILPVWFDEAANDERDPEEFTQNLFNLMEGRERRIAGTDGRNVSGDATWAACVISTGEARLSIQSGLTGFRRRVMELYSPLQSDEHTHLQILAQVRRAYGWPMYWLAKDPRRTEAIAMHRALFNSLAERARGQQVEVAQATNVATVFMGFYQLARIAGVTVSMDELVENAARVFDKLLRAAAEEGADVGERGLRALHEAVLSTPYFSNPADEYMAGRRWGVTYPDGYVGVLGNATLHRILVEYAGIADTQPVLTKWSEQGVLRHDSGSYTTTRPAFDVARGAVVRTRMYLIRIPDHVVEAVEEASADA